MDYEDVINSYKHHVFRAQATCAGFNFLKNVVTIGMSLIVIITAQYVLDKRISIGEFMLINTLLYQVFQPLNILSNFYGQIKQSLLDIALMLNLLEIEPDISMSHNSNNKLSDIKTAIELKNLSFNYDSKYQVLKNISFTIPKNKVIAIVGSSGSGKSTLSHLLLRLYEVTEGVILISSTISYFTLSL